MGKLDALLLGCVVDSHLCDAGGAEGRGIVSKASYTPEISLWRDLRFLFFSLYSSSAT